jgi:hypothetical protein
MERTGEPIGYDAVVLLETLGRAVPPEVDIPAVDPDDAQILGLVVPILRVRGREADMGGS